MGPVLPRHVQIGRRSLLKGMGAAAVLLGTGAFQSGRVLAQPAFLDDPFKLGIASGDPLPDGVVLWTRLAPKPFEPDGGMHPGSLGVRWEVAEDDAFRRIVQQGAVVARPELAHSVHAEVSGLQPGREYFYRFKAGPEISPVGRTRTAPAQTASVPAFSFAFASCQQWQNGLYTAYQHLAAEDLDLVVHVGDYIYEGRIDSPGPRPALPPERSRPEPMTLEQYRYRYAVYKQDEHLRAAHAAFPWLVTWDDHEVENNYASDISQVDTEPDQDQAVFRQRRAAAYQAYYEHQPLRRSSLPRGPDMQLYRRITFGNLAEFNVLDTRQYRSDQACGDGTDIGCVERLDPARSITGATQETWLLDGLARSNARWNVLAQQVVFCQRDFEAGALQRFSMDAWDGYAASRNRVRDAIIQRGVNGVVVITGDVHVNYAIDMKADFDNPSSATIGTEFVGTSIATGGNGADTTPGGLTQLAENPHIKFFNAQRGYVRCTLTPERWRTDYRVVPQVTTPGAAVSTRASFVVERSTPGLQPA
jgi:alkaline phosphatase D